MFCLLLRGCFAEFFFKINLSIQRIGALVEFIFMSLWKIRGGRRIIAGDYQKANCRDRIVLGACISIPIQQTLGILAYRYNKACSCGESWCLKFRRNLHNEEVEQVFGLFITACR